MSNGIIDALLHQVDSIVFALAEQAELALQAAFRACLRQRETEEELEAASIHEGVLAAESDEMREHLDAQMAESASLRARLLLRFTVHVNVNC